MQLNTKTGILLINLGTPQSPDIKDVKNYLHEFLLDRRVIDKPWFLRQLLVRGIIVPRRLRSSSDSYKQIWTTEGSPLMVYSMRMKTLLQEELGDSCVVELAMRYQQPSITQILEKMRGDGLSKLIIFPLFPQYASATTGSVHEKVMSVLRKWETIPEVKFINSYFNHPAYIDALVDSVQNFHLPDYDHVILSYHGLPKSYLVKADKGTYCQQSENCCKTYCTENFGCYGAHCYATSRDLARKLQLKENQYTVTFQSRLGKEPWVEPYTAPTIMELLSLGKKKIVVMCPAFLCDCLETIHEIGVELRNEFLHGGGETLDLVPCLNDSKPWILAMKEMIST